MNQVTMPGANLTNATMLNTKLSDANLEGSNFADANLSEALIRNARFDQANLTRADLRKARVEDIHLPGATLASTKLDLRTAQIDDNTYFTGASMQKVWLTGCSLSKVAFTRADLTEAHLDNTDLIGADFTGAQLGSKEASFTMNKSLASDLNSGSITSGVRTAFQNGGHPLSGSVTLELRIPNENWAITDVNTIYTITNNGSELIVWVYSETHDAAVLAGAYMPNAVFTNANLYAVDMSGVNWYGVYAKANNADLEDVNLANANLGSMDFTQARMYGCTLTQAILIETIFNGAYLRPSVSKKPASLAFSHNTGSIVHPSAFARGSTDECGRCARSRAVFHAAYVLCVRSEQSDDFARFADSISDQQLSISLECYSHRKHSKQQLDDLKRLQPGVSRL
ncbi:hypothetical protein PAALTS15_20358 [Paenibacillus alvei TS-15]|uniref:Pentapeptide repeat-containing protein n=1 Tax=Paenibacillus alvei TS-15 TaxID=1117108 RepID=S9TSK7_PAEAL|nr:pentapeptide repeat-containing protein [Paenibacillus alvei]EPY05286.1 hypothetical protein PAALTS15_20358 [Paenibacillus alvei TS-15]